MVNTPTEAVAAAGSQSAHGPAFGTGECQMRVRIAYAVPSDGTPTAAADWANSKTKHKVSDSDAAALAAIPIGAPLAWTGGSHGYGHRAINAGHGLCWSTDIKRNGYFDLVPITEIHARWGLTFVGWTEDIDGTHVIDAPKPAKKKTTVKTKVGAGVAGAVLAVGGGVGGAATTGSDKTPAPTKTVVKVVKVAHKYPNADQIAKSAAAGARVNKTGKRHTVFVTIGELVKPYVSK